MKNLAILVASSLLFACGGGEPEDEKAVDPIAEKADQLHESIDRAHEVEGMLEDQKTAIDEALDEAERQPD